MMKIFSYIGERLWIKVMVAVMAVIVTAIAIIIYTAVTMQRRSLEAQSRNQSEMLATAVEGAMFDALAVGDNDTVRRQFARLSEQTTDLAIFVFDFTGDIVFSTHPKSVGAGLDKVLTDQEGRALAAAMLNSGQPPGQPLMETIDGRHYQSAFMPILNEQRCYHCHGASRQVLGGMQVRVSTEAAMAAARKSRDRSLVIGMAGIAILAAAIFLLIKHLVNTPVHRLLDLAGKMRQGDLTHRIMVQGCDEISHMSARMNKVNESLRAMINEIKTATDSLSSSSSRQASAIEQTSASLEELTSSARQNAAHTTDAKRLINDVQASIEEASGAMDRLVIAMTQIESSSEQISAIIKTIDEIAFQTNLLALNAAVEAARAGVSGAGFAVVAEEVRRLAKRSAEAARSTGELIAGTVARIRTGAEITKGVTGTFTAMTRKSLQAVEVVDAIDKASEQQVLGIEQINTAIGEIDAGVQQTASDADQLTHGAGSFKTTGPDAGRQAACRPGNQGQALPCRDLQGKKGSGRADGRSPSQTAEPRPRPCPCG